MAREASAPTEFAFTSRGDRVRGRVWLPDPAARPAPLLLLPGAEGPGLAAALVAAAAGWAARGAAVALFDLPLCGERRSAKLSALLLRGIGSSDPGIGPLLEEFLRQSSSDLGCALAALGAQSEIDAGRCAAVGFELASPVLALWCAGEPRVRAAALGASEAFASGLPADPEAALRRFAPRPLLRHTRAPREAADAVWDFLAPHLA